MIRKQRFRFLSPNPYTTHHWFAAAIAAGVGAAGSIASAAISSGAAGDAAGTQNQYAQLGIDELRNALGPSMDRLNREQGWSDNYLRNLYQGAMAGTQPYRDAGARGLGRLNYLLGTDNGLGAQPTAPTAPKAPKYSKDPKTAAGQKKAYQKALKVYDQAKAQYDTDSAAWTANSARAVSDPQFGSLMKPYEDTHGYGQRIVDTAAEKYDDKYASEILDTARDTFGKDDFVADPGYEFRRSEGNRGIEQSAAAHGSLQSGAALKELTRFNEDTASNEFDRAYGRWGDQRNTKLGALTGEQAFDYNAWDRNKGARLLSLGGERDFDFGNFKDNRDFQYGALNNMVGVGQQATDDQNQLREYFGGARTANRLATANQLGNWRNANAAAIAEFLSQQGNAQAAGQVGAANAWSKGFQGVGNALGTYAGYYGNQRRPGVVYRTPPATA